MDIITLVEGEDKVLEGPDPKFESRKHDWEKVSVEGEIKDPPIDNSHDTFGGILSVTEEDPKTYLSPYDDSICNVNSSCDSIKQKTVIELDESSMDKLLDFTFDSDESDDENYTEKKEDNSPVKGSISSSYEKYEDTSYNLDTAEMHSRLQEELNNTWSPVSSRQVVSLEELSHIRSVHVKVHIDSLEEKGNLRRDVSEGKICFQCMKTKFGLFCRARKCDICNQSLCSRCVARVSSTPRVSTQYWLAKGGHSPGSDEKERAESEFSSRQQGSVLSVCEDCRQLLLQVTREGETTARMVAARSVLFDKFARVTKKSGTDVEKSILSKVSSDL